jgi:soluble lytic murein transglycosylase-like protein
VKELIIALILSIAAEYGVPGYLAVAICENESSFVTTAIHINEDGSVDQGLMQLNSNVFGDLEGKWMLAEHNIRAGIEHLAKYRSELDSWYAATISYNGGIYRTKQNNPNPRSVEYAVRVFKRWEELAPDEHKQFIGR